MRIWLASLLALGMLLPSSVVKSAPKKTPKGFHAIGGHHELIQRLREEFTPNPRLQRINARLRIDPPRGFLLHGPTGTGKTAIAAAVAEETGRKVHPVNAPDLIGKFKGETEGNIREAFAAARRENAVLILDEIDAIAPDRTKASESERGYTAQLLTCLQGITPESGVTVVGTTNRLDDIDVAVRRRLQEFAVSMPDRAARAEIFAIHTQDVPLARGFKHDRVVDLLDGYSGGDIRDLIEEAERQSRTRSNRILERYEARFPGAARRSESESLDELRKVNSWVFERIDDVYSKYREAAEQAGGRPIAKEKYVAWMVEFLRTNAPAIQAAWDAGRTVSHLWEATSHGLPKYTLSSRVKQDTQTNGASDHDDDPQVLAIATYEVPTTPGHDRRTGNELEQHITLSFRDFKQASKIVRPAGLRKGAIEEPLVTWEDIAGQEEAKQALRQLVEGPHKNPAQYQRLGKVRLPRGVLLFGPHGTGKTLLAKALAKSIGAGFLTAKASDLVEMWHGESARNVAELFRRASANKPVVIFLDEVESLLSARRNRSPGTPRDNVVEEFLSAMDGLSALEGVVIVGATNRPDELEPAVLRPGRFDRRVYVGLPDVSARLQTLRIHTRDLKIARDVDLERIARDTKRFSGADLEGLVVRATLRAADRKDAVEVTRADFETELARAAPSVSVADERLYERLRDEFDPDPSRPKRTSRIGF